MPRVSTCIGTESEQWGAFVKEARLLGGARGRVAGVWARSSFLVESMGGPAASEARDNVPYG
jgi:hypothetical protein